MFVGAEWGVGRSFGKARATLVFLLAALSCLALAPQAQAAPPTHVRLPALDVAGLNHACGVATDSKGDLYATSAGEGKIKVYDSSHALLSEISNANEPCALAVTTTGTLYVSEKETGEVVRYKPSEYPPTGSVSYGAREVIDASGKAAGIAVDRTNNRLYVAEGDRISVYNADGTPYTVNEVQKISVENATGGTFTLSYEGSAPTKAIEYPEASATEVKEALEEIPALAGNVEVERLIKGLFSVTFVGALAAKDVPTIEADGSGLTGSGSQEVTVSDLVKSFNGFVGEGALTDATGVAAYTGAEGSRLYLSVADASSDELKLFGGPTALSAMRLQHTISGVDQDGDPETPDQPFEFGAAGAYLAADPGNESAAHKCTQVQFEGRDQLCTGGHLFLYDAGHEVLDELDSTGRQLVDQLSAPGIADGEPTQVAVDRSGTEGDGMLYVSSGASTAAKLVAFGPLAMPSRTLDESRSHVLAKAKAIATDFYGYVYVVAQKFTYVFDPKGTEVVKFEVPEANDLAIDSQCNVYTVEGAKAPAVTYYDASQCPPTPSTTFTRHEPLLLEDKVAGKEAAGTVGGAVNPADDHVFVAGEDTFFPPKILEFEAASEGSGVVGECAGAGLSPSSGKRLDIDVDAATGEVYYSANARRLVGVTCGPEPELAREDKGGGCPNGQLGANPVIAVDQANGHLLEYSEDQGAAREYEAGGACVAEFGTFIDTTGSYRIAIDNSCAVHEPPLVGEACEEFDPAYGTTYVAFDSTNKEQKYDVSAFGGLEYPEPAKHKLTVEKKGSGSGTVKGGSSAEPSTIDCGTTCEHEYLETEVVTLTATPSSENKFEGWTGCEFEPSETECEVMALEALKVVAKFGSEKPFKALKVSVAGTGEVTGPGIDCPGDCEEEFGEGVEVLLSASAPLGSELVIWLDGDCQGVETAACTVTMDQDEEVTAEFGVEHPLLTVKKEGGGTGKVSSEPSGIDCGVTCSHKFNLDEEVELTAKADPGSKFQGWREGDCEAETVSATEGTCEVKMSGGPMTVTALIAALPQAIAKAPNPIGYDEAILRGEVNPNGEVTKYHFEYLTQAEYEEAGNSFVGAQSTSTANLAASEGFLAVSAPLTGLVEGTEYRFRLVAVAKEVGEASADGPAFTTLLRPQPQDCANAEYRTGPSTFLPDCRAYELVTPPPLNEPVVTFSHGSGGKSFNSFWVAPRGVGAGEGLGFGALIPGVDPETSRATRGAGEHPEAEWGSEGVGFSYAQSAHEEQFHGVSADQRYWLLGIQGIVTPTEHSFPIGEYLRVPAGTANGMCIPEPKASFEASDPQARFELVGCGDLGTDPEAEGSFVSVGGTHVIFTSKEQLEAGAPPKGTEAIYDREAGSSEAAVISTKPEGGPFEGGEAPEYIASTEDGESVLFKAGGALYAHRGGKTTEVAASPNTFAGVSEDGSRVFYIDKSYGGSELTPLAGLFVCGLGEGPCAGTGTHAPTQIATNAYFVNVSPDGSHVYFTTKEAGNDNLYLWEKSATSFVAVLDPEDLVGFRFAADVGGQPGVNFAESLREWTSAIQGQTGNDLGRGRGASETRSTPDGQVMVFQSHAKLTSYENEGHGEIYRYAPGAPEDQQMLCVSCDPSGTPPSANSFDTFLQLYRGNQRGFISPDTLLPNVTDDGRRVFFQSKSQLLPSDANQATDVYEWQAPGFEGPGGDRCERPEGCLALISSGQGETSSVLYGMDADGANVFFETQEKLFPTDTLDSYSLYDARELGGIPYSLPAAPCAGDACQPPGPPPPALATPATTGAGEEGAEATRRPCPKGKHRVKGRCVKKKHAHKRKRHHRRSRHRRANHQGRAQR